MVRPHCAARLRRAFLALAFLLFVQVSQAAAGSVRLYWDANTEPDLAGYVLVWGTSSGVYSQSLAVAPTSTTQEVASLGDGTYYLAVRAFNAAGLQSAYSNEVVVVVSSPTVSTPSISAVSPAVGPTAGGTSVSVQGTGFQTGATVRFGSTAATVLQVTPTTISARTPAGAGGPVAVVVTNPDGGTATRAAAFTFQSSVLPTVTSFSPALGPTAGGTDVTITGTNFQNGVVVRFGSLAATVTAVTTTRLVARTPAQAKGTVTLTVLNPDGNGVQVPNAFTFRGPAPKVTRVSPAPGATTGGTDVGLDDAPPTITSISPDHGAVEGGNVVLIAGTGFAAGASVSFGGQPAAIRAHASGSLTVVAPTHASGNVAILVSNADSQSATAVGRYTYDEAAPLITGIVPGVGPTDGGTTVTISGQRFGASPTLRFGGVAALVLSSTPTAVTVAAPAHAVGAVDVELTFGDGVIALAPASFTYEDRDDAETFTRYFAEGASGSFFETRFALANPHAEAVPVTVTFTDTRGTATTMQVTVAATSRLTIDETNRPALASEAFATRFEAPKVIAVERTMTWAAGGPAYGAHSDTGVTAARTSWIVAEGATINGFNTFYLLQNPTTTPADVEIRYLLSTGQHIEKIHRVGALSRTNVWVNKDAPELESAEMSATITSLNEVPVVVERSMYRSNGSELFSAGHNSAAVDAPALRWFLAEGATGGTFDEFVLIANPNATAAILKVSYLRADKAPLVKTYTAAAQSRLTIWVDQEAPDLAAAEVSVVVECLTATPVVVERSMWWRATPAGEWTESHNSRGVTTTAARWLVADGQEGGASAASTYVLVANTAGADALVKFTLLTEAGTTRTVQDTVTANGRYSMDVAATFPEARGTRFSVLVESVSGTAPLVVERASYSSTPTTPWAAGTNSVGLPLP